MIRPVSAHSVMSVEVGPEDTGPTGQADGATQLRWVQRAVDLHLRARSPSDEEAGLEWTALTQEIRYRRSVLEGDRLKVRTWAIRCGADRIELGSFILRGVFLLTGAVGTWSCLDPKTHRPVPVPARLAASLMAPPQYDCDSLFAMGMQAMAR